MYLLLMLSLLFSSPDSSFFKKNELTGFKNAISITSDGKGFLYVLDNESNEISKIDDKLNIIKKVGKKGWNSGEFDSPTYIDGSSGLDLYVSDGKNYRVQRFDLNLSFVTSLTTNTVTFDDKLKFDNPVASVIVNSNNLYVVDGDNKRIVIFQSGLTPLTSFGGFQSAETPFVKPIKILKDGNNLLYILDKMQNSVFVYDSFGNYIKTFNIQKLISISIYNNFLYFLTENEIILYDLYKKAYVNKIDISENFKEVISDFLVYSDNEFLILEKNKLVLYNLIN
jgi:hypothetical protein